MKSQPARGAALLEFTFRIVLIACFTLAAGCGHSAPHRYPIGIYGVRSTNDFPILRDAGFNLVAGPAREEYLNAAGSLGLGVLAAPGTSAGNSFSILKARDSVLRFDKHPALWAWYLVDEPDLNGVSPEDVRRAHRFVKSLNARKPTALVLYQGGEAQHYGRIADITVIDRYPIPWLPLANFPQHVRLARLAVPPEKPLVAVIQAFDWSYYPKLLPEHKGLRPPTYEELRCMTYCALARRATGLFYYCYNDGNWKLPEHPAVWQALRQVVAEVNQRLPLFEGTHLWWPLVHEFPDASAGFNAALESSVTPALLEVPQGNQAVPNGKYLLAVSNANRQLVYRITPPALRSQHIPVLGESREVRLVDGWIEDKFEPYGVHVYGPLPVE